MTKGTDPLHAYSGADLDLRDAIERLCVRYIAMIQNNGYVPGTLHLANDIMRLVKGAP